MRKILTYGLLVFYLMACEMILEPQPVALLVNDLALNEAADVSSVRIGLYNRYRSYASSKVLAGDFTADMLVHNGTFSQYAELSNKSITPANSTVAGLWGGIYGNIYVANFILERLPAITGITEEFRNRVTAEARFMRAYSYFTGVTTYGRVPLVITTDITTNSTVPRSETGNIISLVLEDMEFAINNLPEETVNPGFLTRYAAHAFLARFYMYYEQYADARTHAEEVINSGLYALPADFSDVVFTDFTEEAIFEVGYTINDDPGTSTVGLNNLFLARREIIPSNEALLALSSDESGDRFSVVVFDFDLLTGSDNGWSVAKYGTPDENNNNIIIFRLAEMYLIQAEALVEEGLLEEAADAINVLRVRANAPSVTAQNATQMRQVIENERLYELAYEGHRWYDLKRTGRLDAVMNEFSSNWESYYNLWPVPERELQNNPSLAGDQNPGY